MSPLCQQLVCDDEPMARRTSTEQALERMREIALALPEATEEVTWGTDVNFRVRKKIFAFPRHGDGLTFKADPEEREALLADDRFTPARYLARGGWLTMDLTKGTVDWDEITELITTSYCLIAPKTLARQVTAGD
jgi:predicted DNA-binding protein (MmcQ/YjbR family)